MTKKCIIVGAFAEIIELAEDNLFKIIGLIDSEKKYDYMGYSILGTDNEAGLILKKFNDIPIIITPDNPAIREKLAILYTTTGFDFSKLISKNAFISRSATIGNGSVVQSLVNISSEVMIGSFVKLNTSCNVMHNSQIGDYTTIAPNAVVLGNVYIGKRCYIGANSTILQNCTIVDDTLIGAGAVVTKNIEKPGKYVGVPAIRMKE